MPKLNLGKLNQPAPPPQKDTSFGDLPFGVPRNEEDNGVMSFIESAKVSPIKTAVAQDGDLSFEAR